MFAPLGCSEIWFFALSTSMGCAWVQQLRQGCDILKDPHGQNILETAGMLWSLKQALRVVDGGFGLIGIPCNSFNWMSSSGHCRTPGNPYGNPLWWVEQGTTMASRACLVIMVLICRSIFWMVENPDRSAVAFFPPLVHIMSIPEILPLRVHWFLGCSWTMPYQAQCLCFYFLRSSEFIHVRNHIQGKWDIGVHGHWSRRWDMEMRWVLM